MYLFAPANTIDEAREVIRLGADGIYIGGVTTIYSNYPLKGSNWSIGENRISINEFNKLVDECKKENIHIQYNAYTDCFSDDILKENPDFERNFKDYIKIGISAGVDSIVLDDLSTILKVYEMDSTTELWASYLFDTINTDQIDFFRDLNISTVELSPQLQLKEIKELNAYASVKTSLIGHLGCAAFEGACYLDHFTCLDDELVPIGLPCKARFKLGSNKEEKRSGNILDFTSSCSICNLIHLRNMDYLKITGRHIDFNLIKRWIEVYRYALNQINNNFEINRETLKWEVLEKFPDWKLWCRLNKIKGCMYDG